MQFDSIKRQRNEITHYNSILRFVYRL